MNNFLSLISGKKPVLVDFYATWCGPCKAMSPIIADVKSKIGDKATVIKIDVDQSQNLCMQYDIRSVPTLMIFKEGQLLWRGVGVHPSNELVAILEQFI